MLPFWASKVPLFTNGIPATIAVVPVPPVLRSSPALPKVLTPPPFSVETSAVMVMVPAARLVRVPLEKKRLLPPPPQVSAPPLISRPLNCMVKLPAPLSVLGPFSVTPPVLASTPLLQVNGPLTVKLPAPLRVPSPRLKEPLVPTVLAPFRVRVFAFCTDRKSTRLNSQS